MCRGSVAMADRSFVMTNRSFVMTNMTNHSSPLAHNHLKLHKPPNSNTAEQLWSTQSLEIVCIQRAWQRSAGAHAICSLLV
jgi:hypothetical protein